MDVLRFHIADSTDSEKTARAAGGFHGFQRDMARHSRAGEIPIATGALPPTGGHRSRLPRGPRPCWIANHGLSSGHIARDHASCPHHGFVTNRHARQDERSAPNPDISADVDRASEFQSSLARCRIARMVGGQDLNSRPNLGPVANADLDNIQDDAVEVQENSGAKGDVEPVVAVERRSYAGPVTDAREALAQQRTTLR